MKRLNFIDDKWNADFSSGNDFKFTREENKVKETFEIKKDDIEKDLFETGSIYEAEDFIDDSKSLLKELSLIFNIIDTLKLNMKINL